MLNLSKSIARSELFCSRHWDGKDYLVQFYTFLAVSCVVLSVTATLENLVILVALQNIQHMCDHDFLRCTSGETDLHCSGQTPRPVIRDNIWASCNCQQNSYGRPFYVDEKKLWSAYFTFGTRYHTSFQAIDNIRADYFNVFLLRNISHHSTSTNKAAG